MPDVPRPGHLQAIERLLRHFPVVALLGARQVGKTTLARQLVAKRRSARRPATIFDLEDPRDLAQLADPTLALANLTGLVVIDELHRRPDLFPVLRVLADRPRSTVRFLVLGSASLDLLKQGAESLAGRIGFHRLGGLGLDEVGEAAMDRLWLRGSFPRAFTAPSIAAAAKWRRQFVRTFLERDLPGFGLRLPAPALHRFWTMLAHWHGQIVNLSELGTRVRRERYRRPPLPRRPHRDLRRPAAPALVREHLEAAGEGAKDLPRRFGAPPHVTRRRDEPYAARPSEGRGLVGGIPPRRGRAPPGSGLGSVSLLGHARGGRAGLARHRPRPSARLRVQADHHARDHTVDARGARRPEARAPRRHPCRRYDLPARSQDLRGRRWTGSSTISDGGGYGAVAQEVRSLLQATASPRGSAGCVRRRPPSIIGAQVHSVPIAGTFRPRVPAPIFPAVP